MSGLAYTHLSLGLTVFCFNCPLLSVLITLDINEAKAYYLFKGGKLTREGDPQRGGIVLIFDYMNFLKKEKKKEKKKKGKIMMFLYFVCR